MTEVAMLPVNAIRTITSFTKDTPEGLYNLGYEYLALKRDIEDGKDPRTRSYQDVVESGATLSEESWESARARSTEMGEHLPYFIENFESQFNLIENCLEMACKLVDMEEKVFGAFQALERLENNQTFPIANYEELMKLLPVTLNIEELGTTVGFEAFVGDDGLPLPDCLRDNFARIAGASLALGGRLRRFEEDHPVFSVHVIFTIWDMMNADNITLTPQEMVERVEFGQRMMVDQVRNGEHAGAEEEGLIAMADRVEDWLRNNCLYTFFEVEAPADSSMI